jgi:exopolysaccharide biosynthesis polyprenyl glycosylphosphotransferase
MLSHPMRPAPTLCNGGVRGALAGRPSGVTRWLALTVDAFCAAAAVYAAYFTRAHLGPPYLAPLGHPLAPYVRALPVVVALWLLTAYGLGLYAAPLPSLVAQLGAILRTSALATLLVAAASFLSGFRYSRAMLLLFGLYGTAFELLGRGLVAACEQRRLRRARPIRALIVGAGELAGLVADKLAQAPRPGYECLGFVACDGARDAQVVGKFQELPSLVRSLQVDEVFVAAPGLDADQVMEVIEACSDLPTRFYLVAGPLQMLAGLGVLADLSQLPVIELPGQRPPSLAYLIAKRLLDIALSAALLVLLAPLMLVVAWLIRRHTGESALFVQERSGYRGRPFRMYKFRTMRGETDPYAPAPTKPDDPRVTSIGRWLRRYSLDELPQLINVLRGDMSLVGPRPEMPFLVARYRPWQRRRLEVRPGLTGLWQIMGRKDLPLIDNLEYDFYYLRHQSLLLDLEILLRTIPAVLRGRGAY